MALRKRDCLNEIFRLLNEQRELLKDLPSSSEQVRKNHRISARICTLVDRIICLEQSIARGMQESFIRNAHGGSRRRSMTPWQREVVQMLAEGKTMREAARILGVVPRTVAFHKYRVMRALGLHISA
jgi:DNA-binding NarL/FixJ family response regulator